MTPNAKSLPKVYITIKNEIIPPLPSGPGVLGVFVKTTLDINQLFGKPVMNGTFSSQSEFLDAFSKLLEQKEKGAIGDQTDEEKIKKLQESIKYKEDYEKYEKDKKELNFIQMQIQLTKDKIKEIEKKLEKTEDGNKDAASSEKAEEIKKSENLQKDAEIKSDMIKNFEQANQSKLEKNLKNFFSDSIVKNIKEAFANGIPKVCCMLYSDASSTDKNIDKFMALYPEVDIMIISTGTDDKNKTIEYLKKATQNAIPCLGLIGVNEGGQNDNPHEDLVLVCPEKALFQVAGLIGSLPYYESPTFKNINFKDTEFFSPTQIDNLLKDDILPVSKLSGRGWVVCKGITSKKGSHEEISVRRIVHYAVRGTKLICDSFIGQLNTADGRSALRQKLIEFFTRMQRDNAIVPMENPETKKLDPAFMVEVTSTPSDFSLGIVRVALQIRPVRAMNYIDVVLNVVAS